MKKSEIKQLKKKLDAYKAYCLSGQDPFGTQNAYWAAGFEYFLNWLLAQESKGKK